MMVGTIPGLLGFTQTESAEKDVQVEDLTQVDRSDLDADYMTSSYSQTWAEHMSHLDQELMKLVKP